MTTKNTRSNYDNPDSHFGGVIYPFDFETSNPKSRNIANRIASDWIFDIQCRKNEEARNKRIKENQEQ